MPKRRIALVVVDVRSALNVGSLLRTADSMSVEKVALVGITPYPQMPDDERLPHVRARAEREIAKTALGAEKSLDIKYYKTAEEALTQIGQDGYAVAALEQTPQSQSLDNFSPPPAIALVVGNEVDGLDAAILKLCPTHLEIPMLGDKESLNVAVAGGIGLYHLRHGRQE